MSALLVLTALLAAPTCFVPEGPVVAQADGVVARDGALTVDGVQFTPCDGLPGPFPSAVARVDGAVWVGFRAAGLYRLEAGRFTRIEGLTGRAVRAVAVGRKVWVGTDAGLFSVVDDRAKRVRHWVLAKREVTALYAHGDVLEVGAGPYGWWRQRGTQQARRVEKGTFVGCFEKRAGRIRARAPGLACAPGIAAAASGLPSAHITALAEHAGVLYVGTFDRGLARWDGVRFVEIEGAPRFINALLSVGERLWIATPRGLFHLDGSGVRRAAAKLPSDHVNSLAAAPDGTVWAATSAGLVGIGERVRVLGRAEGLPGRIVYAVAVAEDGAVWAGTAAGAARIGPEGVRLFTVARGDLPHDWVTSITPHQGEVWIGTYDAGVRIIGADGARDPGLGPIWVNPNGIVATAGAVFIAGLGDGLWRVADEGVQALAGLPADDVTAIITSHGSLWVGTRGGLQRRDATATDGV